MERRERTLFWKRCLLEWQSLRRVGWAGMPGEMPGSREVGFPSCRYFSTRITNTGHCESSTPSQNVGLSTRIGSVARVMMRSPFSAFEVSLDQCLLEGLTTIIPEGLHRCLVPYSRSYQRKASAIVLPN